MLNFYSTLIHRKSFGSPTFIQCTYFNISRVPQTIEKILIEKKLILATSS